MVNFLGYGAILFLVVFLALFLKLSIYLDIRKIKKETNKELDRIAITNSLVRLAKKINNYSKNLKLFPNIEKYVSQGNVMLSTCPFVFENITIRPVKSNANDVKAIDIRAFIKEYRMAPDNIKSIVDDMADIFDNIYRFNSPLKYRWYKFVCKIDRTKKNILLRILEALIALLEKLENKTNKNNYGKDDVAPVSYFDSEILADSCEVNAC